MRRIIYLEGDDEILNRAAGRVDEFVDALDTGGEVTVRHFTTDD